MPQKSLNISKIRSLYQQAPLKKPASREFSLMLAPVDSSSSPLMQCYKGASVMIEAKYGMNPINKMDKFNRGKTLIQASIGRDTTDLEMRFIRFSLQSNLPAFLGYHTELAADKRFLQRHTSESTDAELKSMITKYLNSLQPAKAD